jgi:hypothetical protein
MDKRRKRIFIITIEIEDQVWDYEIGQIVTIPVISNNEYNAALTFEDRHCGSEYPSYSILKVYDTLNSFLFMPDLKSKTLI